MNVTLITPQNCKKNKKKKNTRIHTILHHHFQCSLFQYLVGKPKQQRKKLLSFCNKKFVCFFSPFLANFHSCSFYEREKDKKIQSTKDKSDDDPWEGGEWGWAFGSSEWKVLLDCVITRSPNTTTAYCASKPGKRCENVSIYE